MNHDDTRPLPAALLRALEGEEEVLVTSRDALRRGTVRMGFAVVPPGIVYLLTQAFSRKAERWEVDPWVRLSDTHGAASAEGRVRRVGVDELESITPFIIDRFIASGAATPEAMRRLLEAGTHILVRVDVAG